MGKKKIILIVIVAIVAAVLIGCNVWKQSYLKSLEKYPNDGEIEFGNIKLTIPVGYIRDTTMEGTKEGYARRWEQDNYKKIVTISRHSLFELNEETLAQIKENQKSMSSTGEVEIALIDFNGGKAIESRMPVEEGELIYLIFNDDEFGYDFSVQGNTSDYDSIKNSIKY